MTSQVVTRVGALYGATVSTRGFPSVTLASVLLLPKVLRWNKAPHLGTRHSVAEPDMAAMECEENVVALGGN